jgi:hypothetical protein
MYELDMDRIVEVNAIGETRRNTASTTGIVDTFIDIIDSYHDMVRVIESIQKKE